MSRDSGESLLFCIKIKRGEKEIVGQVSCNDGLDKEQAVSILCQVMFDVTNRLHNCFRKKREIP